ncbi:MAG TPA: hypothetical protein VHE13_05140, partial [Opitutus sp.]|nr:hypothetical protein [Opitutus sp.]
MSLVNRSLSRAWVVVPLLAGLLVSGIDARRAGRVEHVTALGLASGAPAGDGAIRPALIVPERDAATFATLGRAERLLARGEWRVRRTDEENAPFGRDIHATSPQAWSFALAAWVDHALGGRPIGAAIERAALWFEPALHLLLLAATVVLAAWRFGAWAAVLGSVALATFYPLGAGFLPGVPGGEGLARAIAFGGALLLLAGLRDRARAACWFAAAGMGAGLALWIDARVGLVFLGGAAAGGIGVAWLERGRIGAVRDARAALPWRAWSLAGATTILAGYLIEYAPGQLAGWRLGYIHPIYAVAWIGTAEWLRSIAGGVSGKGSAGRIVALGLAAAAVVAPAALVWSGAGPWPAPDLSLFRLTAEPAGVIAANVWSWLVRDGFNAIVLATLLPLTTIAGAGWVLLRRATPPEVRETVLLAGGPVIVAVAVAARHIGAWPSVDLALVLLLIAAAPAATTKLARASWAGLIAVCGVAGVVASRPPRGGAEVVLTPSEAQELVERDLARWLAAHASAPRPVVFAPPNETTTLGFYGGVRGIGTLDPGNRAGF